jgi:hypothetical protein
LHFPFPKDTITQELNNLGLRSHEIAQLSSYLHFRPTNSSEEQLQKADFEETVDIFDTIETDKPKGFRSYLFSPFTFLQILTGFLNLGSWAIENRGANEVIVSSRLWPGFHHYASSSSGSYRSLYFGPGTRNDELGFMLV